MGDDLPRFVSPRRYDHALERRPRFPAGPAAAVAVVRASRAAASAASASRHERPLLVDELTSLSGGPALVRWISRVSLAVSALVIGSWAVLALAHVDDDYHVSWVTGSWIGLARAVDHGVLYPPLYDGESFGGTRYMPLQFVLHAGVARMTGEYLVSGKLLAYAAAASLYVLAFVVYRRLSGSAVLATGLVAAVLCSGTGLEAATTVRGDALPAALQLAAVALVVARRSRAATVTAALLCSFAFFGKLSAVWGAAAIVAWLAFRDRPRLGLFALSLLASAGALFAIFEVASSGRMTSNVWALGGAGQPHDFSPFVFADKVVRALQELGATWVLLPFAVTSAGIAVAGRRTTIYCLAAFAAAAVAVVVLVDTGAYRNHLLDVQILVGALVAELWRTAGAASLSARPCWPPSWWERSGRTRPTCGTTRRTASRCSPANSSASRQGR